MRKNDSLLSRLLLIVLLALPLVFTSCDDDEDNQKSFPPEIIDLGMPTDTIVGQGEGFVIEPTLNTHENISYSWTINGENIEAQNKYTFSASETGEYKITYKAYNDFGTAQQEITINVRKYYGGFYMVNEGNYSSIGSISYYNKNNQWDLRIFQENNPEKTLGRTSTTGTIYNNKMYLVSKESPYLVETELYNFKQTSTITEGIDGQAQNFCIANETTGVITTNKGAYKVKLNPLSLDGKLKQVDKDARDICQFKDYVFIVSNYNISVFKANDMSYVKNLFDTNLSEQIMGFAQTKDGMLWATTATSFIKIDVSSLTTAQIPLPEGYTVSIISGGYSPSGLCASTTENALYFIKAKGYSPSEAFKYNIDTKVITPLLSAPNGYMFYGSGLKVNPRTGNIYGIFNMNYSTTNQIIIWDDKKEEIIKTIDYSGEYWFPTTITFE